MLIYAALNHMLSNQCTYPTWKFKSAINPMQFTWHLNYSVSSLMFSNRLLSTCQTQLDPAQWPDIQGKSDMESACEKIETRTVLRVDILLSKCELKCIIFQYVLNWLLLIRTKMICNINFIFIYLGRIRVPFSQVMHTKFLHPPTSPVIISVKIVFSKGLVNISKVILGRSIYSPKIDE